MIPKKELLNIPITCLPFEEQIMLMLRWAKLRTSKVVCLANVHMLMEAYWNPTFAQVLHDADLVTPDGKPLVLMLRQLGIKYQNQVAGMDVFLNLCDLAEQTGIKVFFLGSTESILEKIKQKLNREYPILQVVGTKAIAKVTIEEILADKDQELIAEINQSGAGLVFVCLGCPKQEIWMSHYQGSIQGVMIGVGAVFSMYAGINPRAPHWIQHVGLEWFYRLLQEPRRLWRRYGSTIPPFLYLALRELAIPYQQGLSQARWQSTLRNVVVDVDSLDYSAERLGEILVRQNIITREELQLALVQQISQPHLKLGQILVRLRLISLSELKFYLRGQNARFGELLVEKRILNHRSLNNIMDLCHQSDTKIGEMLIMQSIVSEDQLKRLLIEHYTRKKGLFLTDNEEDVDLPLLVG